MVGRQFDNNVIYNEKVLVMMKKKKSDQEDYTNAGNNKTADNKEHNYGPENYGSNESDNQSSDEQNKQEAGQGTSPDKTIHDLKIAEEKLAEMQDKYMRLSAEFDNYRKRTLREKMDLSKYATENILLNILPLMDDFDRALKHMEDGTDCVSMKSGIDLIYLKFSEFFKQNGVREIESLNTDFNVDLHEAIAKIPSEDKNKKGKVTDVILKGYYLNDKVLRFSKVVVGE